MGWWITLGILILLAVLPLGVSVAYDADGAVVKVIAGPVKITLFPRPKKENKPKKKKDKKSPKAEETPQEQPKPAADKKPAEAKKPAEDKKPAEPASKQDAKTKSSCCLIFILFQLINPYISFTKNATKHTTTEIYLTSDRLANTHKKINTISFEA